MKKNIIVSIIIATAIITVCIMVCLKQKRGNNNLITNGVNVIPTLLDDTSGDTVWCATFQLVWNDMQNDVVKQDIILKHMD